MRSLSSVMIKSRDWFPKFVNGLNIKIDIAQKVALLFLRTPLKPHPSKRAPSKNAPFKVHPLKMHPLIMIFREVKKIIM